MPIFNSNNYETAHVAVNAVIFTIHEKKLMVYLFPREKEPFEDLLELPGGLLRPKETAEETLNRKLKDITGLNKVFFHQFHTFTNPNRDPRSRVVSIGFIALISYEKLGDLTDYYPVDSLPKLAFDHRQIIDQAIEHLKHNVDHRLVSELMPKHFPLNELQSVYEVIEQRKMDNRNFRKKILNSDVVTKASIIQKNVNHRPAALYQFNLD